jgi:hypothetical protein
MKHLILALTIIAVSSATLMRTEQRFLQIMAADNSCGMIGSKSIRRDTCGCQELGCSFDGTGNEGRCVKIGSFPPGTDKVHSASILDHCNLATTEASCLASVAWINRFGGKTDCAWCGNVCNRKAIAGAHCTIGTRLDKSPPPVHPTPAPKDDPKPEDEDVKEAQDRVKDNGGLTHDKTLFAATLIWDNCNDLDLSLKIPPYSGHGNAGTGAPRRNELVNFINRKGSDGSELDIDRNNVTCQTNKPVENIRYAKGQAKNMRPGLYTLTVTYFDHYSGQAPVSTPYKLILQFGSKTTVVNGDSAAMYERDYYFIRVTNDGKMCYG